MKIKIMISATKIRMKQGMDLETILSGWPNLSEREKEQIREAVR